MLPTDNKRMQEIHFLCSKCLFVCFFNVMKKKIKCDKVTADERQNINTDFKSERDSTNVSANVNKCWICWVIFGLGHSFSS